MDIDEILLTSEESIEKAIEYLKSELRGLRTGRASTALVEFIKVDYYGSMTDLRSMALISIPEPTQLLIKPFDASSLQAIVKAIQASGLGLNPMAEGKQIRLVLPSLSGDRRNQLIATCKQKGEEAKIAIRNARRDANKHVEAAAKDSSLKLSEDQVEAAKEEVTKLVKKYEAIVEDLISSKSKEIQTI